MEDRNMGILASKIVLLTGALGTLGRAQARRLAAEGARLLLLDRPGHARGPDFAASLPDAAFIGQDLGDLKGSEAAIRQRAEASGGIDVLINNAAHIVSQPFESGSLDEYEEQMRINASAAFALARAVAPGMKARGYGKIVNFCSVTQNGRWDDYTPYVMSKSAALGLTKSLARELGPYGINVNAVAPGAVVSEAEERVFGDRLQQYNDWVLENQCLKRRIEPSAIAETVLFLVSPASDMITGQNIAVDGGF
jgi:NAD(P)-dependent dehydrogenase (short-subunit alcohol dehydrogenase family)